MGVEMAKTAVLVDGSFYLRRAHSLWEEKTPPERAVELRKYVFKHIGKKDGPFPRELYRVFYYDCPPIDCTVYHPLRGNVDLGKEPMYKWNTEFLEELKKQRKFALRLGSISAAGRGYALDSRKLNKLCRKEITVDDLDASRDFHPTWVQKGVDMKLGLDISSLAYEGIVDQIVLIAGDSDFVPAAKVARRKGIDFILDPMGSRISPELFEHVDGIESFIHSDPSV